MNHPIQEVPYTRWSLFFNVFLKHFFYDSFPIFGLSRLCVSDSTSVIEINVFAQLPIIILHRQSLNYRNLYNKRKKK